MTRQMLTNVANQTDIADYLMAHGIRLKKIGSEYVWEEQNVWIRGCSWYSHYEQTGGNSISFVMRYFGKTYSEAVSELNDIAMVQEPIEENQIKNDQLLPDGNKNTYRIELYLQNKRGIALNIVKAFVEMGLLYEDAKFHNCVFVGRNENWYPRHCHKRSTITNFRQTTEGSLIEYSFHYIGRNDTIYVFEAPIDMLAFITLHQENWRESSYVALCSVSEKALMHQLETHPRIRKVVLCLDNDKAGTDAIVRIRNILLEKGYSDIREMLSKNKDWDEDLQILRGIKQDIKKSQ